VRFSTVTC